MREETRWKLSKLLNRPTITPQDRKEIMDAMCAPSQRKLMPAGSDWTKLRSTATKHRSLFRSNRQKWDAKYADIYDEYVALLDRAIQNMDAARIKLQPDGSPHTVASFAAARRQTNQARELEGKAPLPVCGERWQDWIPEAIRADYIKRLDLQYAADPNRKQGKRFVPFITAKERKWVKEQIDRLEATIHAWRKRVVTMGTPADPSATSDTPFGALMLAACRMAERELAHRLKTTPTTALPDLPVNWRHLLTLQMRTRLRDGEISPDTISLEGITQYYLRHPNYDPDAAAQRDTAARAQAATESTHE